MINDKLNQITLREFILWLLRRRRRFRVTGNSMQPLLNPGDEVLINHNAYQQSRPNPGEIVIAQHPYRPQLRLIKRVAAITDNDYCILAGDNPQESTDSRTFGPIPLAQILGRVTSRF